MLGHLLARRDPEILIALHPSADLIECPRSGWTAIDMAVHGHIDA